jgi:CXXX repeat modification system protein
MKMAAQHISESDIANILTLHHRRLGWGTLLVSVIADRNAGFPCEKEEFFIRRELKNASQKVSDWFYNQGQTNHWPSMEGWMWEIDFALSKAVPKKQTSNVDDKDIEPAEGVIMTLGEIDTGIISRLIEKTTALEDEVRSHLRLHLEGNFSIENLNQIIDEFGAANENVHKWFSEMAKKYNWPPLKDSRWIYYADTEEGKIYIRRTQRNL